MATIAEVRTALGTLATSVAALIAKLGTTVDPAEIQALLDQITALQAQIDAVAP